MSAVATRPGARPASRSKREKPRLVRDAVPVQRVVAAGAEPPPADRAPLLLDVRGAPMAAQAGWTLAVLESLELGRQVLHVNSDVPWWLFPMLETRGARYEITSRTDGEVRVLMWRHWEPDGAGPATLRVEEVRVP